MIFRHPLSTLTRITSSTLKYASSANLLFPSSIPSDDYPSTQQLIDWMQDAQQGMDAFFDDHFDMAYVIFAQHASVSPFHALGFALLAYVEAMVSFEVSHIQLAQERLAAAESLCHQFVKRTRRRFPNLHHCSKSSRSPSGLAATATAYAMDWYSRSSSSSSSSTSTSSSSSSSSTSSSSSNTSNVSTCSSPSCSSCSLASSTTFVNSPSISLSSSSVSNASNISCTLSSSSLSSMAAALRTPSLKDTPPPLTTSKNTNRLRPASSPSIASSLSSTCTSNSMSTTTETGTNKSNNILFSVTPDVQAASPELQFEVLETNCMLMSATLQFLSNHWMDYMRAAYKLRKTYKKYEQLFELVTGQKTSDYAHNIKQGRKRKRPSRRRKISHSHLHQKKKENSNTENEHLDATAAGFKSSSSSGIQSGVFFGIGLLSLIFSLLPPKLNKLLNTLGFHSSRPFALQLLQQSYHNQDGMYSSLSALALLAYYTNLSSFIHPALLPNSLTLSKARNIVNDIKIKYPHGKIWKLLEGKLYRMEGNLRKSVEVLRDCRRRESVYLSTTSLSDNTNNHQSPYYHLTMTTTFPPQHQSMVSELALQISALSVYEMGWGQIFLGDYFQASETFFRLESMNNWSRAFYHYIATCCLYGDEEYDKAAIDFVQIPRILARRRRGGTRLLPNEQFAESTIQQWMKQATHLMASTEKKKKKKRQSSKDGTSSDDVNDDWRQRKGVMDGSLLQQVVYVHPLWELIYLWNGIYHVSPTMLLQMKQGIQQGIDRINSNHVNIRSSSSPDVFGGDLPSLCSELGRLQLLSGVVERELGNMAHAETCFKQVITLERACLYDHQHEGSGNDSNDNNAHQHHQASNLNKVISWAGSYAFYEMALLRCLQAKGMMPSTDMLSNATASSSSSSFSSASISSSSSSTANFSELASTQKARKIKEAREWLKRIDQSQHDHSDHGTSNSDTLDYASCESACMLLHIRCQLLSEKLDELSDG